MKASPLDEHEKFAWNLCRSMVFLFCGSRGIDVTGAEIDAFLEDMQKMLTPPPLDDLLGGPAWSFLEKLDQDNKREFMELLEMLLARFRGEESEAEE
ncbi:MAG: hypothetical protein JXA57_18830 [Armatimonadetes bacterium]|nr:hypothetical protein [Armatimonadota bacterium]